MPSLPALNSPLPAAAALLFLCTLLQSTGSCPLAGQVHDARRLSRVAGILASATALAMLLSAGVQRYLLAPAGLDYLNVYAAIVAIASGAQSVAWLSQKRFGITIEQRWLLPLTAIGPLLIHNTAGNIFLLLQHTLLTSVAIALLYCLSAAQRERLQLSEAPTPWQGLPIQLLSAGLSALALMGFAGLL